MERENFGSRFGVLVAMAGSAIGLGNLWRFPYLVGSYGGAAFIFVYIFCVFLLCLPIFISEVTVGRRSHSNAFGAFKKLAPGTKWKWLGAVSVVTPVIVVSYYSVVGGWSVEYFLKAVTLEFTTGMSQSEMGMMFGKFISSVWSPLIGHTIFLLLTAFIIIAGVKSGIEKFGKIMMPLLFVLIIIIAVRASTLPGAGEGLKYLFQPDFSKIDASVCAAALGQAFFSLSLGVGTILTYGSYVKKDENIIASSTYTASADFIFALLASCAIMPAVFAFGLNPQEGPGLVFETLPFIFANMPLGWLVAILFFLALIVAALTSSISLYEVGVAYLVEEKGGGEEVFPSRCIHPYFRHSMGAGLSVLPVVRTAGRPENFRADHIQSVRQGVGEHPDACRRLASGHFRGLGDEEGGRDRRDDERWPAEGKSVDFRLRVFPYTLCLPCSCPRGLRLCGLRLCPDLLI